MELTQTQLNTLQSLTVSASKIKTDSLAVGQQLQVKVAAVDPQSGEVTLKINDTLVTTKLDAAKLLLQLSAGQNLQLTVTQTNANKVVLQLPSSLFDAITQQKALREALPKQQPIVDTLIQLKALLKPTSSTQLPTNILAFAKNFIAKLPTPEQLGTAAGIKQAIKQSGIFLENKLAQIVSGKPSSIIDGDIKALLLGLKSTLLTEKNNLTPPPSNDTKISLASNSASSSALKSPLSENTNPLLKAELIQNKNPQLKLAPIINNDIKNIVSLKFLNSGALSSALPKDTSILTKSMTPTLTTNNIANITLKALEAKVLEIKISEALLNAGNIENSRSVLNPDKQLTDKQIQQILNNLLGHRKTTSDSSLPTRTGGLSPLSAAATPTTSGFNSVQQYTGKEIVNPQNEIALSAIKSQNVSEVSAPRLNSLVDIIEALIKQVDSAISRTQVHQLNTLQDQETNKLTLRLEIPVNDNDDLHLIQLEIEKEQNKKKPTETIVTVTLALDLNNIGPVYARITLIKDKTNVVIWAERDDTFKLVEKSVDKLHTKLENAGLKSDGIACHHGLPPQNRFVKTENNNGLVDEHA